MTAHEVKRTISTRLSIAATRVEDLSAEEQRLLDALQETREQLARARDEEARMREADQRHNGIAPEVLREAIRRLGTFTVSELASELDCSTAMARKRLAAMLTAVPAWVVPAGRALGHPVYEYVKPTDAGVAFTAQQRLRDTEPTPEERALFLARPEPSNIKQSLIGSVNTKELRAVVREAVAAGWLLEHTGGSGHSLRLTKGKRRITIPTTPRNAGDAADMLRKQVFGTSSRRVLREAQHA